MWDARTLGGTINLRQNGDPNGAVNTVAQFASPAQVYGREHPRHADGSVFQERGVHRALTYSSK